MNEGLLLRSSYLVLSDFSKIIKQTEEFTIGTRQNLVLYTNVKKNYGLTYRTYEVTFRT